MNEEDTRKTMIQWTARVNELRRMKVYIEKRLKVALEMCNRLNEDLREFAKNE